MVELLHRYFARSRFRVAWPRRILPSLSRFNRHEEKSGLQRAARLLKPSPKLNTFSHRLGNRKSCEPPLFMNLPTPDPALRTFSVAQSSSPAGSDGVPAAGSSTERGRSANPQPGTAALP